MNFKTLSTIALTGLLMGSTSTALAGGHSSCSSSASSCSNPKTPAMNVNAGAVSSDIIDTAVNAGSFNTLAAALGAADLFDALKSDGPFTVFAPTDDAFAELPKGTVETLLKPENKKMLQSVLLYHVVPGKANAETVLSRNAWSTLNGQRISISQSDSGAMVNNAKILTTDIKTSNGVIHVIDTVILPETKTIPEVADSAEVFSTLLAAASAAGLAETLMGDGPFTVFAPTDDAFAQLPAGTVESLLKPENRDQLASIVKYHVVSGRVFASDAIKAQSAETVQGSSVRIKLNNGQLMVNDSRIVTNDIQASNGVIHVIDQVMLPH